MRTKNRIVIGVLVGLFFAGGYAARIHSTALEQAAQARGPASSLGQGTRLASAGLDGAENLDFQPLETLYQVDKSLHEHYVEPLTQQIESNMTYDALKALLGGLNDPNTRFIEPAQRKIIGSAMEGKFHGIGAILNIKRVKTGDLNEEHLYVIDSLPQSPADKAGLKTGDDIIAINDKVVLPFDPYQRVNRIIKEARKGTADRKELQKQLEAEDKRIKNGVTIFDAENQLMSEDKKDVELTVIHSGATKPDKIKLTPKEFTVEPVTSSVIDGKYGYIKINWFSQDTGKKFDEALKEFKSQNLKGLVLDLRNVAGARYEAALDIAKSFAPGKTLGTLQQSRNRKSVLKIPGASSDIAWKKPVVTLVNGGTARMAEVLASALKENGVAKLVGDKTYGDLTQTTLLDQKDGSSVMITTGIYLTSKNGNYSGTGVPVDVKSALTGSGDSQLNEAVKMLAGSGGKG